MLNTILNKLKHFKPKKKKVKKYFLRTMRKKLLSIYFMVKIKNNIN